MPPAGSRAAVLARFSSDMQNPRSADDQIREAVAYCHRQGWIVVLTEKDEARTGRTTAGRTGYYNVMACAEAGECDVVVIESVSRMAREAADMLMTARKLSELGVVICTTGGGVLSGFELVIRAQVAQEQSEEKAQQVIRGQRGAASRGKVMGGVAYGYDLLDEPDADGHTRIRNEETAPIVERIYEDIAAGMSTHAICNALNAEGVAPPGGGKLWRPKAITGNPHLRTGIGRNPLYVGKLVYGKTQSKLISSTGQTKVTPGLVGDQVVYDVPHLRIVSDELWHTVQDILDNRTNPIPNRTRHPTYVFSGLIHCGCCGQSFPMVSRKLGCEGRRQGTGCKNRRRVSREELQDAVLGGLKARILQPHILDLYLDEYRREVAKAAMDQASRLVGSQTRLQDLDVEIENIMKVIRSGSAGPGAQLLHQELDRLGTVRKQIERQASRPPASSPLSLETDAVIARLGSLLDDLGNALTGPERDAARARDIIRSFITKISVVPLEVEGREDGRGVGPVRITVEGSLTQLLDQASADRMIQRRESTSATLGLPNVPFSFYADITKEDADTVGGVYADVAVFSRLLDDADAPVARQDIVNALHTPDHNPTAEEIAVLRRRADNAIAHLVNADLIRSVMVWYGYKGWVWTDREVTDQEWIDRGKQPRPEPPIGIIPMKAPEAFVVVVGPPEAAPDEGDQQD